MATVVCAPLFNVHVLPLAVSSPPPPPPGQDKTASHGTPCCDGGACEHKEGGCLVHQATDSEEFANIQEAELVGR